MGTRNLMIILTLYRMLSVNHMSSAVPRDGLPLSTHETGPWRSDDLSPVTVQIPDTANNYRSAPTSHNLSGVAQQMPPAQARSA